MVLASIHIQHAHHASLVEYDLRRRLDNLSSHSPCRGILETDISVVHASRLATEHSFVIRFPEQMRQPEAEAGFPNVHFD